MVFTDPPTRLWVTPSLASWLSISFQLLIVISSVIPATTGLGTSCTTPLGPGHASPDAPYWLETIPKRGSAPFNPDPNSYKVFRNVKDYGALGDGATDDTDAINQAMADGTRCGEGCDSSTITPAVVYFPKGVYLVSRPIIAWYYTSIVGDAKELPTLLLAPTMPAESSAIDADPYIPNAWGAQWYQNQNNFFRSIRNLVIDMRQVPPNKRVNGLHWQVSQATSLTNIVVEMSQAPGNKHQGMFMENGSGGYMGDLIFRGGNYGLLLGNQQFTVRNLTVENAAIAISTIWNWGWTFQRLYIRNCGVGIEVATGGRSESRQTVGAELFLDVEVSDTKVFIQTSSATPTNLDGSIIIENAKLTNVQTAVAIADGTVIVPGGDQTIEHWVQGNVADATGKSKYVQGEMDAPYKPPVLLDYEGKIFGKTRPQYVDYDLDQIVSVKECGAKGDGVTDDTAALTRIFEEYSGCKIIFFDAGSYLVTSTLFIPDGTIIVGEIWSEIMGSGPRFGDPTHPVPVVKVGTPCSGGGVMEISDIIFTTRGATPGAIVVEWNAADPPGQKGAVGTWDTHIRLAATTSTGLSDTNCPKFGESMTECQSAFLALHLTPSSTGYFEGMWVWLGDHDLDGTSHGQITVYSGRGVLSESAGPVWLVGTAEHHAMYQYNFAQASNHYIGLAQTETPYYQPKPPVPNPFQVQARWADPPIYEAQKAAWGIAIQNSQNILIYGAGLYSFFRNYEQSCLQSAACQDQMLLIDSASTGISVLSLSTVGTKYMVSVEGKGVVKAGDNQNGFANTLTRWVGDGSHGVRRKTTGCHHFTEFVVLPTRGVGFP